MFKKILLYVGLMLVTLGASAQSLSKVTGKVTDAQSGESLIGVTIKVEGTATGTITSDDGHYSLDVPSGKKLIFSYIGYNPVTESVDNREKVDVKMTSSSQSIDEYVVVGYQSLKKSNVLGAVSTVKGEMLNAIPVSSTAAALQGRVAGVTVQDASGAPGSALSVRIRGVGSINSSNEPLYIVDGVPTANMSEISPNDIESVTVLKDASSAAIYGSRANNGVVLITTKKGKKGAMKITYNGQMGVQTHGHLIPMANTAQYIKTYNAAATADGRDLIQGNYLNGLADVNQLSAIFRTAPITSHEISIGGGDDKTTYLISGSYFNQQGIIQNSGYQRGTLRANIDTQAKSWLKLGVNMNGSMSATKTVPSSGDGYAGGGGSIVRYAMFRTSAIPIKDANDVWVDQPSTYFGDKIYNTFFGDGLNPEGLAANTDDTNKVDALTAKVYAIANLPFNLKWTNNMGLDYSNGNRYVYNPTWGDNGHINNPNSYSVSNARHLGWVYNSLLNHEITFNKDHHLSTMLGFEAICNTYSNMYNSDQNYPVWNKNVITIGNGLGTKYANQSNAAETLASFFGQVNYDYQNRYYLSGTIRRDGSSHFTEANRWGTFGSVSGGWSISQEAFMQKQKFINLLKLRAGYGWVGNQNVGGNPYPYVDAYSRGYNYPLGGSPANGYALTTLGNPNLKWETSKQGNIGLDIEILKGALAFSVDYYNKTTDNMLIQSPIPPSSGNAVAAWENSSTAKVMNRGVDMELAYRKNYKDGGFNVSANAGFLKNEVLAWNGTMVAGRVDNGAYATQTEVGYPIGSFYMYKMDGIFQNNVEIMSSAHQSGNVQPGDVKYADVNHDGVINANDRVHVGSAIPTMTLGINLGATYKGFDLTAFFQGAFGQKIYNQIKTESEGFYRGFNVTENYANNYWTGAGSTNTYPRPSWSAKPNNDMLSTRFLEDGSYLRLKNLQLGYTFNMKNVKGISKLRAFVSATNLLTFTKYTGLDPEMTVSNNAAADGETAAGIDWGTYPVAKTYTFGINLEF